MCDETTFARYRAVTRREFGALSAAASVALLIPRPAAALDIAGSDVDIETPDGIADCYLAHPVSGAHAGVVVWPDARGMRTAYREMANRLAEHGYAVLVMNPYYRGHRGPVLPDGADPRQADTMAAIRPLLADLSPETESTDAIAMVEWLEQHASVDSGRKIGTMGFCLGGPSTFRTAAHFPERVGAAVSFHGVRLVTDQPSSPHLLVPTLKAEFLIVIAEDDDQREPEVKNVLSNAFAAAGVPAEIEVYEGAMHSFTTTDSAVHHPEQAQRAWARMIALFERALA
jgi:carboxymethylenebutenolidase